MTQQVNNLDQLHDLMVPAAVSWWPLAPGWFGIIVLLIVICAMRCWKALQRRRNNAYRRTALRELALLNDALAIAELLRRTALAIAPRAAVAGMTGTTWADWLATQCPETMPDEVHQLICRGIYSETVNDRELSMLRDYAARWISRHKTIQAIS